MAQREIVVVERRELHRVLEQAGPGGEARGGHVRGPRVVLGEPAPDPVEVQALLVGHHVELVGGGELDVAPDVGEQLGQLRLFRRHHHDLAGAAWRTARTPASSPQACGRRRSAAARTARSSPCPRRSAPGRRRPLSAAPAWTASSPPAPSRREHGAAQDEQLPVPEEFEQPPSALVMAICLGFRCSSTGVPMTTITCSAVATIAGSAEATRRLSTEHPAQRLIGARFGERHLARVDRGDRCLAHVIDTDPGTPVGERDRERQANMPAPPMTTTSRLT